MKLTKQHKLSNCPFCLGNVKTKILKQEIKCKDCNRVILKVKKNKIFMSSKLHYEITKMEKNCGD